MRALLLLGLISMSGMASPSSVELWEDYGDGFDAQLASDEDYRWLYEQLISERLRASYPDESFKSFRVHLRDTHAEFPEPQKIVKINLSKSTRITGKITYAGIFPKEYKYSVSYGEKGEILLSVRIHLKGLVDGEAAVFAERIQAAQDLWNSARIKMDFDYAFRFALVESEEEADFSVRVLDSTRGPYDRYWSRRWDGRTIAHEIGHMMGLGDEYRTVSGTIDCLPVSLMCTSYAGDLMYHHYYFILRRLISY